MILGAGFGGLEAAKALGKAGIAVTIIDRQNHHLFQPLLYQVATAALSAADIAEPIRSILRGYPTVDLVLGEIEEIDHAARQVRCAHGAAFDYDYLIVATGARTGYFGNDHWQAVSRRRGLADAVLGGPHRGPGRHLRRRRGRAGVAFDAAPA